VTLLKASRTGTPDPTGAFTHAVAALEAINSERSFRGGISRRLLYKLRNAERVGLDRALALEQAIQEAQLHEDAADRFSTPAAVK
jgi:hypothetical protein